MTGGPGPGPGDGARGPLAGLVVVDLTRALAGPYATMLLADLGADVIKVEPPDGDMTRDAGPFRDGDGPEGLSGYFHSVNRNKRGVVADLATPEGVALVRGLAARADVLMENFRTGVMDRMGLSYESLSAENPRLVYGALRGFGDPRTGAGPHVDRPAYDVVAQAMGGVMAITGMPDGPPVKVGPGVGDIFPAALTVIGVLAAIHEARITGRGAFVDVAMYDAMVSLCERSVYQYSFQGEVAGRVGNDHPLFCPFGVYRAADGWVTVAAPGDRHWARLAEVIERPELGTDPRFATNAERATRRDEVRTAIEAWTGTRTRDTVVAALSGTVPCGPVNTADAIFADPHVTARNMLVEVEQPGSDTPATVAGQPIKFAGRTEPEFRRGPLLGEHTAEILAEFGIDEKGASADAAATQ